MKAAVFDRFGDPAEVLQIKDMPQPVPGPGQVRVRMIASPINPSDLIVIRGDYTFKPDLPARPGFEGVGVVEQAGAGFLGRLRMGKRVAVINGQGGNWAEQVIVPARQVVPVSSAIPDDQAAAFFVNPATALVLTRWVLKVPRGAWLLQTAAGSALGKMVMRLGKVYGFRTINVVRRREAAADLLREGADAVISTDHESIPERVASITRHAGIQYAIDAVGGATGSAVAQALGAGGRLVLYGTLSAEPLTVEPRPLMRDGSRVEGFWLGRWARQQNVLTMLRLFRSINKLMKAGVLTSEVGATFPLDQIKEAVQKASEAGRAGKVLLRLSPA